MVHTVTIRYKKKTLYKAKVYTNIFLLAKGLRFSKPLQKNQALLLASSAENLQTIDMFFVFFPIDAIWLNKNKKVIHIVRNIRPFTVAVSSPKPAQYILECPANSTKQVKINTTLVFSNK